MTTWKLSSKQDASSSITGGVRTELLSQQGDGAGGQSLGDADGGGEADDARSHHRDPLHPAQACVSKVDDAARRPLD